MGSPFDSGKTIVFKSMSTAGSKRYIDSNPDASKSGSVYLIESMDFGRHPGAHWTPSRQADGSYRLQTVSTHGGSNKRYLDSSSAATTNESVYLKDDSAGGGSKWTPTRLADGSYSMESQTTSGPKRFMSGNPTASTAASVTQVENSNSVGAHWMVGVDYYTGAEVERIIHAVYPGVAINFYQADPKYGSLDYDLLRGIWNDSGLGNYRWTEHKFDCDDFAVCLKAEASKHSYNQSLPDDKGSLCGIMWGRNARGAHAFNFTIDPFENLILFEPQDGRDIAHNEYTPYFCMV